jgi:hypothetical protein
MKIKSRIEWTTVTCQIGQAKGISRTRLDITPAITHLHPTISTSFCTNMPSISMTPLLEVNNNTNDDLDSLLPIENLDHSKAHYFSIPEFRQSKCVKGSPLAQVITENVLWHSNLTEQPNENTRQHSDHPIPPVEQNSPLGYWTDFQKDLTNSSDDENGTNEGQAEAKVLDILQLTPPPPPRPALRRLPSFPTAESAQRIVLPPLSSDEPEFNTIPFGLNPEQRRLYRAHQTTTPVLRHSNQLLQHPVPFRSVFYNQNALGTPPRPLETWYLRPSDVPRKVPYRMCAIVRKMPVTFWRATDPVTRVRSYRWEICGRRSSKEIELANRSSAIESVQPEVQSRREHLFRTSALGQKGGCITTHELDGVIPIKSMARDFYKWGVLQEDRHQKGPIRGRTLPTARTGEKTFSLVMTDTPSPTYVSDERRWIFCDIKGGMWLSSIKRNHLGTRKVGGEWAPPGISVFRDNSPESRGRALERLAQGNELVAEEHKRRDDTPAPPLRKLESTHHCGERENSGLSEYETPRIFCS